MNKLRYYIIFIAIAVFFIPRVTIAAGLIADECSFGLGNTNLGSSDPKFETCKDVNVVLIQMIKLAQEGFKYVGMIAFVAFIVGGFMMIISMGSAEKLKKGRDIMVNAVIGLVIAFSAYFLVNFILDAIGVSSTYRGVGTGTPVTPIETTVPTTENSCVAGDDCQTLSSCVSDVTSNAVPGSACGTGKVCCHKTPIVLEIP